MFNFIAKTFHRLQTLKHVHKVLSIQNYATFTVRDVLHETSDEAGTLLTRFAKHVSLERQKICDQVPTSVKYSDYFPISDHKYFTKELEKTDVNQIANVIIYTFTYRPNADPAKFACILNELDRYATKNVEQMCTDTILRTLYAFLFVIPNWMTRLDFYGQAMERLYKEANKQKSYSKEIFVQLCFYMGLSKKKMKFKVDSLLSSLLDNHLGVHINEMSSLDMALVSNAAYKTATIIKNDEFNRRLLKEVLDITSISNGNDGLLVTFIKSMRLQRLRSSEVCEFIENICKNAEKLQELQARGQVHLFAYLAENLWDNKECIQPLLETFVEQLKYPHFDNDHYNQTVRGKDISTFIWSCAQLCSNVSSKQFQIIERSLLERLKAGEFNYFSDQLVDSCLSLWTLGFKSKELLHASVKLKSESTTNRRQPKVDSRLTVLLSAAKIEEPEWCSTFLIDFEPFDINAKIPAHLSDSQSLPYEKVIEVLLQNEKISSATLTCPIKGINIPGININLVSSPEKQIFLEIMTPAQTLHFSKQPISILRLKLRLLESLGHKVKLISLPDALNIQSFAKYLNDIDSQEEIITSLKNSVKA